MKQVRLFFLIFGLADTAAFLLVRPQTTASGASPTLWGTVEVIRHPSPTGVCGRRPAP